MKIVAGLGSIDDYIRLAKAGADEVFCGFVPYEWNNKYGTLFPLNRREVLYYNVHIGSFEDMKILKKMVDKYKVPVTITLNYLYYLEEQYEEIYLLIKKLMEIGFNEFIVADIALLVYLNGKDINPIIHLSGECCELNSLSIDFLNRFNLSRYIFHRKNTIEDIESCIKNHQKENLQYEAFILNERCHYTGGFCSSLHCDELVHLCQIPYELTKIDNDSNGYKSVEQRIEKYNNMLEEMYEEEQEIYSEEECYMLGSTGCGICFLKSLKEAGVTHLKVVGRGNSIDNMEKDVKNLKKALELIDVNTEQYKEVLKKKLFKGECSGECYY